MAIAGEDGVDVFVNDKPYRRKTEHGQVRIPSLKVGDYTIRVKKAGYLDPPAQTVQIKKGEESRVEFHMQMAPQIAALQFRGGQPGTMILLDREYVTTVGPDGSATLANLKPGDHTLDLKRDGFQPKHLVRAFKAGDTVILAGPDVALEKMVAESKPAPMPPPEPVPSPAANESQPATVPATVHRGGGFVIYTRQKELSTIRSLCNCVKAAAFSKLSVCSGSSIIRTLRTTCFTKWMENISLFAKLSTESPRNCRKCHSMGSLKNLWASRSR